MSPLSRFRPLLIVFALWLTPSLWADPLDHWSWRSARPQGNPLYSVTFGGGQFVAVGDYGAITTSPDGLTWTNRSVESGAVLLGVAYGNGTWVVAGGQAMLASTDGSIWNSAAPNLTNDVVGLAFGAGRFVAVTDQGGILTSTDASNWIPCRADSHPQALASLVYAQSVLSAESAQWSVALDHVANPAAVRIS